MSETEAEVDESAHTEDVYGRLCSCVSWYIKHSSVALTAYWRSLGLLVSKAALPKDPVISSALHGMMGLPTPDQRATGAAPGPLLARQTSNEILSHDSSSRLDEEDSPHKEHVLP
ncbi:uncharacterized protein CLUP02_16756 [Colletotrichum lupini]|uniref:Uncharacterized protein n=1 Tax=Colletotrichum lupini TaxID=145971 RepID=A0A9Q8WQA2_9PEZI|nr:uncharacterized protein CLUP02_16756 [Colletotrichum lupini]UQC91222.1 hypothetical protein CLUP02_16756 [Colletotrichum lupini]